MLAVCFETFGGPEVLGITELAAPTPGPGQVRVRVQAATVNPTDTLMRAGRQGHYLTGLAPPYIPGMELAGVVEATVPDSPWQVGDRVIAAVIPSRPGGGAQAQLVAVPTVSLIRIPAALPFAEATTLAMNGLTAAQAVRRGDVRPGETVFVSGAIGCVGGYVLELLNRRGCRTIAMAAAKDEGTVRRLGATEVIEPGPSWISELRALAPSGVDLVVDAALIGADVLAAVRDGGRLALLRGSDLTIERGITAYPVAVRDDICDAQAVAELEQLVGSGALTPRIAEVMPLQRVADAHRLLASGGVRGRVVLQMS